MSIFVTSRAITWVPSPNRVGWLPLLLALPAMLNCATLTGWHSAIPHVDAPVAMTHADHDHDRDKGYTTVDLHLGAHSVAETLVPIMGPLPLARVDRVAAADWPPFADADMSATASARLLRPPRI